MTRIEEMEDSWEVDETLLEIELIELNPFKVEPIFDDFFDSQHSYNTVLTRLSGRCTFGPRRL